MKRSLTSTFSKSVCTMLVPVLLMAPTFTPAFAYDPPLTHNRSETIKPKFDLGMNFLWDKGATSKLESSFQRMQKLGIKSARTDFEWRSVEATKGRYYWNNVDNLVQLASKYDIELLPIVHYAPKWALPNVKKPEGVYELALIEDSYDDYSRFLNAAIDRYGPDGSAPFAYKAITHWQVWNEPNTKEFWYTKPGFLQSWSMQKSAKKFVELMHSVSDNLGDRRDKVKIVHAGLSKSDITYMWHLWNNDPSYGNTFDIMAIHSYFFSPKGGVRGVMSLDDNDPEYEKLGFIGSKDDHGYLRKVFNVKHFLDLKKSPKPLWVTEIGFMAGNSEPTYQNPWIVKENEAVSLTKGTLDYFQNNHDSIGVDRVYWFMLDDFNFPYGTGNFGVYRNDGSLKQGISEALDNYTP